MYLFTFILYLLNCACDGWGYNTCCFDLNIANLMFRLVKS